MTPEQRDRLVEVMARAAAEAGGARWDICDKAIKAAHFRWQLDAISAAERAGFKIEVAR